MRRPQQTFHWAYIIHAVLAEPDSVMRDAWSLLRLIPNTFSIPLSHPKLARAGRTWAVRRRAVAMIWLEMDTVTLLWMSEIRKFSIKNQLPSTESSWAVGCSYVRRSCSSCCAAATACCASLVSWLTSVLMIAARFRFCHSSSCSHATAVSRGPGLQYNSGRTRAVKPAHLPDVIQGKLHGKREERR